MSYAPTRSTGLHLTARFGLLVVFETLLLNQKEDTKLVLERTDIDGKTLLYLAAEHGHQKLVKLLLDKGAEVNAEGGVYGNERYPVPAINEENIMKLLLDKVQVSDLNVESGYYGNSLHAASYKGHEQVVNLLLDRGVDINAQGGVYGNALQAASYKGHEQIAKLLLDRGIDINAQGGVYGNALQAASYEGHEQVVNLLLDRGANIDAQGGVYGNALQAALVAANMQIVKLLLEKGASVNVKGYYGKALQKTSYGDYEQIVKLLLGRVADVNTESEPYSNAVQLALARGNELIKLLLEKSGVNGNALRPRAQIFETLSWKEFIHGATRIPIGQKCALALTLALSVSQIYNTPWLPSTWGANDVFFAQSHSGIPILSHFNVSWISLPIPTRPPLIKDKIRFCLGVALLELHHGVSIIYFKELEDLNEDGEEYELTMLLIAKRLVLGREDSMSDYYARAVYKCIIDDIDNDSGFKKNRRAFFEDVVIPLQMLFDEQVTI